MLNAETRALKFVAVIWHVIDSKSLLGGSHIARLTSALQMLQVLSNSTRSFLAAQLENQPVNNERSDGPQQKKRLSIRQPSVMILNNLLYVG